MDKQVDAESGGSVLDHGGYRYNRGNASNTTFQVGSLAGPVRNGLSTSGSAKPTSNEAAFNTSVTDAINTMRSSVSEDHTLESLASGQFYSRFHFHRLFRETTGLPPGRFLALLRMQQAKWMLASSSQLVSEVSASVGYKSFGTFTTQFNRLVGTSPGNFRRLVDVTAGATVNDLVGDQRHKPRAKLRCFLLGNDGRRLNDGQLTMVGLFDTQVPHGIPCGYAIIRAESQIMVEQNVSLGVHTIAAVSSSENSSLLATVLGQERVLVGNADWKNMGSGTPSFLKLRSPMVFDPPMVSAAPLLGLAEFRSRCAVPPHYGLGRRGWNKSCAHI